MHILWLTSSAPDFGHFRAAQTVQAVLIEELCRLGHKVSVATLMADRGPGPDTAQRLEPLGCEFWGSADGDIRTPVVSTPLRQLALVRDLISSDVTVDPPHFSNPDALARRLEMTGADVALLFWDTCFEFLLPHFRIPVIGYLARPPFSPAPFQDVGNLGPIQRIIQKLRLAGQERRHFKRMRGLAASANICALDVDWYNREGTPCRYIANTWPDPFGADWAARGADAQARRPGLHILANIGGLNATGNSFGLLYLADRVLPLLYDKLADLDWTVNICGRFDLPPELKGKLDRDNVALRGFVDDIDDEVSGNQIFLLLNNAGPYTGGYTRVIYALAAGSCLIAHERLAESMPELVHNENCLLGGTPEAIADLIAEAGRDAGLRARLGVAGRETYQRRYAPAYVARQLAELAAEAKR